MEPLALPASPPAEQPAPAAPRPTPRRTLCAWWRAWWRSLSPAGQDRFAAVAPLVSVLLFLAAIVVAFGYLRSEEVVRGQEALRRDVEYTQQRLRLRLLERQEQIMRMARELSNHEMEPAEFDDRAEAFINSFPEVRALSWIDERGHIHASQAGPSVTNDRQHVADATLEPGATADTFRLARDLQQPVYAQPTRARGKDAPWLQLQVPLSPQGKFTGVVLAEYSTDILLRYGVPSEVQARYAITLLDGDGQVLAGTPLSPRASVRLPWSAQANSYEASVSPVGNGLMLRAQAYPTSLGVVGNGQFWLVVALSVMTASLLVVTGRHTLRRMQAQQALAEETSFRRAMENSIRTGMRALDMEGRITYVNAAFCQMTGWSERELVGQMPPYSYWPDDEHEALVARLHEELQGRIEGGDFQMRVKRKDGGHFHARLYVSPLVDTRGRQSGWMASMTDITEPNRVREQLTASQDRFTIVLEALDASVSVAPLGGEELLYANRLYRQWFGVRAEGHLQLVAQAGVLPVARVGRALGDEPRGRSPSSQPLANAASENAEIYLPDLDKWLEVRSRYLTWADGSLAQMVIATDITPRRLAEEQAERQAERAQSISRLITMGEMASSMAHELNQPLTAISNYCSGMVSRIEGGQIAQDALLSALRKTAHQAQRAGQVIQRIRAFVKRSEPDRQLSEVAGMVAESVELAGIELRRHNVRLTHYVAARLPRIMADAILIEQVLVNLLKNSAESIAQARRPPAQRNVELRVVPRHIEGQGVIEFTVQDTGKGLAPQVLAHLFEAFFSTKSEGMGMGLNLCRSIVESHHGRMRAENLYNGAQVAGCRFTFWLPLADASDAASETIAPSTPRTTA